MTRSLCRWVVRPKSMSQTLLRLLILCGISTFLLSFHDVSKSTELPQERDFYNTVPGNNQKDSILDAANPMELINRLRRATAMDDATSPSDAIDEALKVLEENGNDSSKLNGI